jgi:hypothetical protein
MFGIFSILFIVVDSFMGIYEGLPSFSLSFISLEEYMNPYVMPAARRFP